MSCPKLQIFHRTCLPVFVACCLAALLLVSAESAVAQSKAAERGQMAGLPLVFEPGIQNSGADFVTRRGGVETRFSRSGIEFLLAESNDKVAKADLELLGSRENPVVSGEDKLSSQSNYLIGSDPSQWRRHVPNFGQVKYSGIYPGIDLVFYGTTSSMEHDFIVAPGADPNRIGFAISGAKNVRIANNGDLQLGLDETKIAFRKPVAYQETAIGKEYVPVSFISSRSGVRFKVGAYDHTRTLVIDPVLTFSTYLADLILNSVAGVAADSAGNTYVAGLDFSPNYPTTPGAFQTACSSCSGSNPTPDVFITKISPDGTSVIYSTFLGGSNYDQAAGIAVDANGNAIIAGRTESPDFPAKNSAAHGPYPGEYYAFVTSLSPDGSTLNYSTLLGGAAQPSTGNFAYLGGVALDSQGNAYVSGTTDSPYITATAGALNGGTPAYPNNIAFVSKFSAGGTPGSLAYTALLGDTTPQNGGGGPIGISGIAVDNAGEAYITGNAGTLWPTTPGAYQTTISGSAPYAAIFVSKLSADASTLLYSTFVSSQNGYYLGLALDAAGDAWIGGAYVSSTFPTTSNAYLKTISPGSSASFFSELDPTGSTLLYSTFFPGNTQASHIAIDGSANIWLGGWTADPQFPLINPIQTFLPNNSISDRTAFLSRFDPTGQTLTFSTYFGDTSISTELDGIAPDQNGKIHIAGFTGAELYTTPNAYQPTVTPPQSPLDGTYDFAAAFVPDAPSAAICMQSRSLSLWLGFTPVGLSSTTQFSLTNCGSADLNISSMQVSGAGFAISPVSNSCLQTVPANRTCSFGLSFSPTAKQSYTGTLALTSNATIPTLAFSLNGQGTVPQISVFSNSITFDPQFVGQTSLQKLLLVQNSGGAPLIIDTVNITISSQFAFTQAGCDQPLQPGGNCVISLTFTPTSSGTITGTLTIPSNDPVNPTVSVSLSGTGYSSYPVPSITAVLNPDLPVGGTGLTIQVYGSDFFPASVVKILGMTQATTYNGSGALTATVDNSLLANVNTLPVTVSNPTPGGGESAPVTITVYRPVAVDVAKLIYEPHSGLLFASIPASASTNANSIVSIDPNTGNLGTPLAVGNNPDALALSDDGQYLYVGLDGDHTLARVNLSSMTLDKTFALPVDSLYGKTMVHEMHVVPGENTTVVASLFLFGGDPAEDGLALFNDSGLVNWLPNDTGPDIAVDSFVIAGNPPAAYSLPLVGSPQFFSEYTIAPSGISALQNGNFVGSGGILLALSGNLIYTGAGQIWDLTKRAQVGTLISPPTFPVSMVPDDFSGNIFFLNEFAQYSQYQAFSIDAYDETSLTKVASIPFTTFYPPDAIDLVRWGQNGFAFVVSNFVPTQGSGQVILFTNPIANPRGALSVSPATLDFGSIAVGSNSTASSFTITNSGSTDIAINSIAASGDFSQTNNCGTVLAGNTCQVSITFNPTTFGNRTGTIMIASAILPNPISVSLTGIGLGPSPSISSNGLTFSAQLVSTASQGQSVSLTNNGNAGLVISSITSSGDFSQTNTCPQTLAAGANCTISVSFTPSAVGSRGSTLSIADNASGSPQTIQLSGTGVDFSFTGSGSQTSATVQAGGMATYNLSLSPTGGLNGTVTLTCTGAPVNASCTVNPNQLSLSSGAAQAFTVSVNTNSPGSHSLLLAPKLFDKEALLACVAPALLLFSLGGRKRSLRSLTKLSRSGIFLLLLLFSLSHLGCGGGGSSTSNPTPPTNSFTPAGTYTITVTATQNTVTRSMNLTLIVQ